MLSGGDILSILTSLIKENLYNPDTKQPYEALYNLTTYGIEEVLRRTNISRDILYQFANQTLPCINYTLYSYDSEDTIREHITKDCFKQKIYECQVNEINAFIQVAMLSSAVVFMFLLSFCFMKRQRCLPNKCWGRPAPVVNITNASFVDLSVPVYTDKKYSNEDGSNKELQELLKSNYGDVTPLNMLDSYENRVGFSLAFGITVTTCLSILFGSYQDVVGTKIALVIVSLPGFAGTFIKMVFAISIALVTYPYFVCQRMKNQLVGGIVGLLFCLMGIGLEVFKLVIVTNTCWEYYKYNDMSGTGAFLIFIDVPKYICLIILCGKFIRIIITTIQQRMKRTSTMENVFDVFTTDDTDWKKEYIYIHVKSLCAKKINLDDEKDEKELTLKEKLKNKLYTIHPGFKYSTRIIATTVVSSIAVYLLLVLAVLVGYLVFSKWWDSIFSSFIIEQLSEATSWPIDEIKDIGRCIIASWWLAIVFAVVFYISVIMNSLSWYRKHIMMLRRGDRSFLPNSIKKGSVDPVSLTASSLKFAGYQVGYCAWGIETISYFKNKHLLLQNSAEKLIHQISFKCCTTSINTCFVLTIFICFILFIIITTEIFLPMKTKRLSFILSKLIQIWPSIVIGFIMMVLQKLMARYCFLFETDTMAINNRKAFHITSYFMFYFNIFLGLVSCLLRIVYGVICGVLFLQRLQKSSLPRSYEKRDPGYLTYLGYLLLEHQHANPSLQCFVRLLLETQGKKLLIDHIQEPNSVEFFHNTVDNLSLKEKGNSIKKKDFYQKRAEIRWHLFIILSQNPSIKKYRKHSLGQKKTTLLAKTLFGILNSGISFEDEKSADNNIHQDIENHPVVKYKTLDADHSVEIDEFPNESNKTTDDVANDENTLDSKEYNLGKSRKLSVADNNQNDKNFITYF